MKTKFLTVVASFFVVTNCFAINRIVSIEGPVEVATSPSSTGQVVYWVQDPQHVRYQVVVPTADRERFAAIIEHEPTSVIQFDGTVVDSDSGKVLNVDSWKTVTKTTEVTDEYGNKKVIREHSTVVDK